MKSFPASPRTVCVCLDLERPKYSIIPGLPCCFMLAPNILCTTLAQPKPNCNGTAKSVSIPISTALTKTKPRQEVFWVSEICSKHLQTNVSLRNLLKGKKSGVYWLIYDQYPQGFLISQLVLDSFHQPYLMFGKIKSFKPIPPNGDEYP